LTKIQNPYGINKSVDYNFQLNASNHFNIIMNKSCHCAAYVVKLSKDSHAISGVSEIKTSAVYPSNISLNLQTFLLQEQKN